MDKKYLLCTEILRRNKMSQRVKEVDKILLLLLMLFAASAVSPQARKRESPASQKSVNRSAKKLSDALEKSASDEVVANEYVMLAKELYEKNDYEKAEDYLKRAVTLYIKMKRGDLLSAACRELAKVLEAQGKLEEAIKNYRDAARYAADEVFKVLNENDAERLEKPSDLTSQSTYLQRNIDLATTSNTVTEQIAARRQMADVKRGQQDNQGALEELEKALTESEASDESRVYSYPIKQEMAQTLTMNSQYEEAIKLNKQLVVEARYTNDPKVEINQLQQLASSYFEAGRPSDGIHSLQEAYRTALENGRTLEAKNILVQIVDYYRKRQESGRALDAYDGFIGQLDSLVKNDSTLVDEKFFRLLEDRITQLEKERILKDELISKKNRYNNLLLSSIVLILFSLAVISKILIDNLRKNKKIALQSLRREMNPHFIFNSLNSVNLFIAENNEIEANKYLSAYSKLMRTMMENSNRDFIPLSVELEQLREYLALELLRFRDKFTYTIHVDETLDTDSLLIPNMLIHPQLENAVWHGLRYKEDGGGVISLTFKRQEDVICVTIDDNGIGIKKSGELKTAYQKARQSRGQTNTFERIALLNHLYHIKITMDITDKSGEETGVIVTLRFPQMNKKTEKDGKD